VREHLHLLLASLLLPALSGCLPRDPVGTLQGVRDDHTVRVGVIHNPPWTIVSNGEVAGVEAMLAGRLAHELGAKPRWTPGVESELLRALELFELDVVIGGLDSATPWQDRVALSQAFHETRLLIGLPTHGVRMPDLQQQTVIIPKGQVLIAGLVRQRGGVPAETTQPPQGAPLVAAPDWQLQAWGYVPSDVVLETVHHVWALPPGENAWLEHIDRFLHRQRAHVPHLQGKELR
jgi:hypothetical protein